MQQEPKCTLTNEELIEKVKEWIINLARSGVKSWMLTITANVNEDPDLLIGELVSRFEKKQRTPSEVWVWVKASKEKMRRSSILRHQVIHENHIHQWHIKGWNDKGVSFTNGVEMEYWELEILEECYSPDNKDREIAFGVWLTENTVAQYENGALHSFRLFGPYTDNIDYTPQEAYAYWESLTNKP